MPAKTRYAGVATAAWYLGASALWLCVRALHTYYLGWGSGFDVNLFFEYARAWNAGLTPYVNFEPEYPPGAMLVFRLPHLLRHGIGYTTAFAYEMAAFDLACCLLVLAWARRLAGRGDARFAAWAVALYLLLSTALFPVIYARFDLAPAALAIAALFLAYVQREAWGATLLGIAGTVKLWPFALIPLWWIRSYREGGFRQVAKATAFMVLGTLIVLAPFWRGGLAIANFLQYHSARGLQVGSTWASISFLLDLLGWVPAHPEHNYGAFHVEGPAAAYLLPVSTVALLVASALPALRGYQLGVGTERDRAGIIGLRLATATILGFIIGSKVLSPQFMLWLVPFLPLVATGWQLAILALLAAALTTVEYPYMSAALEMREPGHIEAVFAVLTRNVCLIALYVALLLRPRAAHSDSKPEPIA